MFLSALPKNLDQPRFEPASKSVESRHWFSNTGVIAMSSSVKKLWAALFLFPLLVCGQAQNAVTPAPEVSAVSSLPEDAKVKAKADFLELLAGADPSEWHAVDPNIPPTKKADKGVQLLFKMKVLDLNNFCTTQRFSRLAHIEALDFLSVPEKKFCKERLKSLNPLIQ